MKKNAKSEGGENAERRKKKGEDINGKNLFSSGGTETYRRGMRQKRRTTTGTKTGGKRVNEKKKNPSDKHPKNPHNAMPGRRICQL